MYNKELITEYERILKDPAKVAVDTYHFKNKSPETQEKIAVEIIKYAICYICHYTPSQAARSLNEETLKRLKLQNLTKYIKIPTGLDERGQYMYIVSLCFPEKIKFDRKRHVEYIYEKVLDAKNTAQDYKYPKGFFTNHDAQFNAAICLQYMLKRYVQASEIDELYKLFADEKTGYSLCNKYQLSKPVKKIYAGSALNYLHESLNPQERSEFLYYTYNFSKLYKDRLSEILP